MHYLDANASEPLRPEARAAMLAALAVTGNPASVHAAGRAARRVLEEARETIAAAFGGRPADLVFTSGGTEADALAIHALSRGRRVIVGATEHHAVLAAAPDAAVLPVDRDGVAELDVLAALLDAGGPALVCLMLANNETGTIQPVAEAAALCRRHGALLHVDAVQAAGRMAVELRQLGASSLALSSHKLGGPTGAGALLLAPEVSALAPLIAGGGQERGRRGGTPPLAAIAGFAAAVGAVGVELGQTPPPPLAGGGWGERSGDQCIAPQLDTLDERPLPPSPSHKGRGRSLCVQLRDAIERAALDCGTVVCGGGAPRLDNTTCLGLPGVRADAQVIALDLEGIAVSAGAACSSGKVTASHVLQAMGLGELAGQAIRVSLPWNASEADVAAFVPAYRRMAERLRAALPVAEPAG